jgi:predicted glycoside hydrolase/deacetylase ChbG (UPF0249 family)
MRTIVNRQGSPETRADSQVKSCGPRTIALCVDDFGLAAAIDDAALRLAGQGRVQAVSCMVETPRWPEAAQRLRDAPPGLSVGLHLVLTRVLAAGRTDGADPSPGVLLWRALGGLVDRRALAPLIDRQLDRFEAGVGRRPDHVDGHHHVHAMPLIAEVLCERLADRYGGDGPWLRVLSPCLPSPTARARQAVIAMLGRRQRTLLQRMPMRGNAGFGGVRSFRERCSYGAFLERQLAAVSCDGTLIMCHPGDQNGGAIDDEIGTLRPHEYEFLAGPEFPAMLSRLNRRLAPIAPLAVDRRA